MASHTFIVDAKYYPVRDELIRRGWIESDIQESQLLWTNLKHVDFESPSFHWINHFKSSQHFSNKAYLTYHLLATAAREILPLTWSPACHDIKHLIQILLDGVMDDSRSDESVIGQLLSSLGSSSLSSASLNFATERGAGKEAVSNVLMVSNIPAMVTEEHIKELFTPFGALRAFNLIKTTNGSSVGTQAAVFEYEQAELAEVVVDGMNGLEIGGLKLLVVRLPSSPTAESIWIVKPIGLSCGENISVYKGFEPTLTAVQAFDGKCIVQKYIERPLLVRERRKFDIRQWVLVTSIDPLVVYCFSECYLRLSSMEFSLAEAALHDPLVHLTNHSIQRSAGGDKPRETRQSADGICDTMMTQGEFDQWLKEQYNHRGFDELLRPQIAAIATQVVLSVRDRLTMVQNGFEWLGLDLMVMEEDADNRLKVVLLEANTSPDISLSTPVTARLVPVAIQDLFKLIFDEELNRPWSSTTTAEEMSWQVVFNERRTGKDAFRYSDYCDITAFPILQQSAMKRKSPWKLRSECRVLDRDLLDEALIRIEQQKTKEEKSNKFGNDEDEDEI